MEISVRFHVCVFVCVTKSVCDRDYMCFSVFEEWEMAKKVGKMEARALPWAHTLVICFRNDTFKGKTLNQ